MATCGYDCVVYITSQDPCNLQQKCLCLSTSYLNNFHDCINRFCDAAGIAAWIAYGEKNCAAVGVTYSAASYSATVAATAVQTSVIYLTSAVAGQTSVVTLAGFPYASSSANGVQPATQTTPASAQTTQDSKSGLGAGAIAGIAIGAVALVSLAILAAFFIWRGRRNQPRQPPPEITQAPAAETYGGKPDMEKEVQSVTTTSAVYNPEFHAEQATYPAKYDTKPFVPDTTGHPQYHPQQLNPAQMGSFHHLSPSSANTELAAVVPSEVAPSTFAPSDYRPSYNGTVEADSAHQSRITSPVSEIGSYPPERSHELSSAPYVTPHSPMPGYPGATTQELSSSPPTAPAPTFSITPESSVMGRVGPRTNDADDEELERMKSEIEAVRVEKDRVLQLQALEDRERELSRKIVNRELSRGGEN